MPPDDPRVIAVAVPFEPDPEFEQQLRDIRPGIEVAWTPYVESAAVRSSKGKHGGRDPEGLPTPEISDEFKEVWGRANVVIGMDLPSDADVLLPRLQWFQAITAGVDQFDLELLARMGVRLTTASGIGAVGIAEFVFARLLQVWKHLRTFDDQQARHEWTVQFGSELAGRTIGIVGLGAIGREVAARGRAFGMTVLATRASARPGDVDPDVDELHPASDLDAMLSRCDAVVAALPSNPSTNDLFDAGRFAAMRNGVIFCNVGRGAHVVEDDLVAALRSGRVGAAVLDVTRVEPLPDDHPLWDEPNVYLSPHSSVSLDRYAQNLQAIAVENLSRFVEGRPLRNEVDVTRG